MKRLFISFCLGTILIFGALQGLTLLDQSFVTFGLGQVHAAGPRFVAPSPFGSDLSNDCTDHLNPCLTLQHAVDEADSADEIRLATGIYTGVSVRHGITQVVFISKTIDIQGGYPTNFVDPPDMQLYPTTLDAQGQGRVIFITNTTTVTLQRLRITGGNAAGLGGGGADQGGGISIGQHSNLTISHSQIFSNTAGPNGLPVQTYGGGLYTHDFVNLTISQSDFFHNTAGGGGGLYARSGNHHVSHSSFYLNEAEDAGGGLSIIYGNLDFRNNEVMSNTGLYVSGGGLYSSEADHISVVSNTFIANQADAGGGLQINLGEAITISENLVVSNSARFGAGLYLGGDVGLVQQNQFLSNTATEQGGGLLVVNGQLRFSQNTIADNATGGYGGGLHLAGANSTFERNLVRKNRADVYGGGFSIDGGGKAYFSNNVIAENQAAYGGSAIMIGQANGHLIHTTFVNNRNDYDNGGAVHVLSGNNQLLMTNTIIAGHANALFVDGTSQIELNSTLWYSNAIKTSGSGTINSLNNYDGNPNFSTDGYHLTALSVKAIDRGLPSQLAIDLDGELRPQNNGPDLGADEILLQKIYLPINLK